MGVVISINPNRSDVALNLDYAKTQLKRAHKKAMTHYAAQPYLCNRIKELARANDVVKSMLATADREKEKDRQRKERWHGRKRR